MGNPETGDMIPRSGGMRKLRFPDERRGKGKRGGLRIVYYFWRGGPEFWLFMLYDKDEADDLTPSQVAALNRRLKEELEERKMR